MRNFLCMIFITSLSISAIADEKIRIMVTCDEKNQQKNEELKINKFINFLNKDSIGIGKNSVRLLKEIELSEDVFAMGASDSYNSKKMYLVELSYDKLNESIVKKNAKPYNPNAKPPKNILELLEDMQMSTGGNCDFLAPTRLSILHPETNKLEGKKSVKEIQDELLSCLEKVEELKSKDAKTYNSLIRDIKRVQQNIESETNSKGSQVTDQ